MSEGDSDRRKLPADGMLRREHFNADLARFYLEASAKLGEGRALSEEAREASRQQALAEIGANDVWVFGYGSLIWNPALKVADSRKARVDGYRRHFCLRIDVGRGTPDRPGLMLGLDRGEGCHCVGVAHRIAAADLDSETKVLWYREMLSGAYRPAFLPADVEGLGMVRVLTFVIERSHPRYEGTVGEAETARRIAQSEGALGTNRDYLYRTATHLEELGIEDTAMARLAAQVRALTNET